MKPKGIIVSTYTLLAISSILGFKHHHPLSFVHAFTNVATNASEHAGSDLAISGSKDGGFAWGDINEDGYLDVVVNTRINGTGTRVLISDPSDPTNPVFSDLSADYCQHCTQNFRERSALLADLNNDGYVDLVRNTSRNGLDIYLNQGPDSSYAFGIGTNNAPNKQIVSSDFHDNKVNTEGILAADYNNDGWLDLIIENHNFGIDLFENPGDGTANFICIDPSLTGLPSSAKDGDYAACVDFDNDGDLDIIARKRNQRDFFINNGDGTFNSGQEIGNANNSNKGGVVFGDFDNDGDFDVYWTDQDENQIWMNNGTTTLVPTKSGSLDGEPWLSAGISAPSSGIDGCAVGDVNNDGKLDLFLTANSGTGYLFINNTPTGGTLSFTRDNLSINVNGNGEGCAFADYDNDGDLDLYVNINGGNNQLWRNNLNENGNENYLMVAPKIDLGNGISRAAIGANVILKDNTGQIIGGVREVPTVSGHGTDAPDLVHFGLPNGPDSTYRVSVHYLTVDGTRDEVEQVIVPSAYSNRTIPIYHTDALSAPLSVAWHSFDLKQIEDEISLKWKISQTEQTDYFQIERSTDGQFFQPINNIRVKATSSKKPYFSFKDKNYHTLDASKLYYRIKHVYLNGASEYSAVRHVQLPSSSLSLELNLSPNPASNEVEINIKGISNHVAEIKISDTDGRIIFSSKTKRYATLIPLEHWKRGTYIVQVLTHRKKIAKQLVIH